ncbi:MAG: adenine deaminase, partial [Bacillota bacterium]
MIIINLQLLKEARGDSPAELVLKNAKIVDVFNEEIYEDDLAISSGKIIGVGNYQGRSEVDLKGKILAPSFVDGHLHLESAMV